MLYYFRDYRNFNLMFTSLKCLSLQILHNFKFFLLGQMTSMNEKSSTFSNINVINSTKTLEDDNLVPEISLVDTSTSGDQSKADLLDSINKNTSSTDEPSNAVLLAGLEDLSVNDAMFGVDNINE